MIGLGIRHRLRAAHPQPVPAGRDGRSRPQGRRAGVGEHRGTGRSSPVPRSSSPCWACSCWASGFFNGLTSLPLLTVAMVILSAVVASRAALCSYHKAPGDPHAVGPQEQGMAPRSGGWAHYGRQLQKRPWLYDRRHRPGDGPRDPLTSASGSASPTTAASLRQPARTAYELLPTVSVRATALLRRCSCPTRWTRTRCLADPRSAGHAKMHHPQRGDGPDLRGPQPDDHGHPG